MYRSMKSFTTFTFLSLLSISPAYALDKIYSPQIVKGELEMEYSGSTSFDNEHSKDGVQSHEVEFEYGVTDRILVEMAGEFEKEPGENLGFSSTEVGGRYKFSDQGEYWVDSGILVAYKFSGEHDAPDAVEAKLLLEKQTGPFLHRANIGLEQEVGHGHSGGPEQVVLWNSRYKYDEHFQPGIEIQSNFGKTNEGFHFKEQEHYIGPAAYGKILPNVKYEAAYLFGASDAAAQGAARILLEYEVYF